MALTICERLQNHLGVMFVVDEDVTQEIQVKTAKVCTPKMNAGYEESCPDYRSIMHALKIGCRA